MLLTSTNILVLLERQYAQIKSYVGEANQLAGNIHSLDKLIKPRFTYYTEQWDLLEDAIFQIDSFKHLSENERNFVSSQVFAMMKGMIYAKRLSAEALQKHQSGKTALFELLLNIKKQFDYENVEKSIPTFGGTYEFKLGSLPQKRHSLRNWWVNYRNKRNSKTLALVNQNKKYPQIIRFRFARILADLKVLTERKASEELALREKIRLYRGRRKAAERSKKVYEVQALDILIQMVENQLLFEKLLYEHFSQMYKEFAKKLGSFE
ncbi:MAG: hypothetical protein AAF696_03910 [Bacteroidota bacterium]